MFSPPGLDWFSTIATVVVGPLLQPWPTLEELPRASTPKVASFLGEHRLPESRLTDYGIFSPWPGAGPARIPRLIAALGTQRERYATASAMQGYAGMAPVTETSGKPKWVRWTCPQFLRQTFHEWAGLSSRKVAGAKHFYHQQREPNKS